MAKHLTDKDRQRILAIFAQYGEYAATARDVGVSISTVKRIVEGADQKTLDRLTAGVKERNTASILAHMEKKREVVNEIIDKGLTALNDDGKLATATPSQITTALGTLIDKFAPVDQRAAEERPFELPARVIGRAFVDLNREIKPNISYVIEGGRGSLKSSFISLTGRG